MTTLKFRRWLLRPGKPPVSAPYIKRSHSFVIDRSTEILDRKGVEIYEGDIVEGVDEAGGVVRGPVVFEDAMFKFKTGERSYACVGHWRGQLEIVGNIYEENYGKEIKK